MELLWMNGFALKKCTAGGNGVADISCSFNRYRYESSLCSVAVSFTWPPVCLAASWWISRSLWAGSGIPSAGLTNHRRGKEVTTAQQIEISISLCATGGRCPPTTHTPTVYNSTSCCEQIHEYNIWKLLIWDVNAFLQHKFNKLVLNSHHALQSNNKS